MSRPRLWPLCELNRPGIGLGLFSLVGPDCILFYCLSLPLFRFTAAMLCSRVVLVRGPITIGLKGRGTLPLGDEV